MICTIESFECKGIWWPSDNPAKKARGTLKYIPNQKASLDLIGSLDEPKMIYGISSDAKNITLCISSMILTSRRPGFGTSEYIPSTIFVGGHLPEQPQFTSVSINYSYLQDWLDTGGFIESRPPEISVTYKKPEKITAKINNAYNISIDYNCSFNHELGKNVNMKQTAYIIAESNEERPLDEYKKIMDQTMNLLTLAIGEPVYPLIINARTKSINPGSDHIMIYYPSSNVPMTYKSIHPLKMLFSFKDISESFDPYLRNWFLRYEKLHPTYDLYFDTMYTSRLTIQTKFLNLVQALEAYHRRNEAMKRYNLPEEEHQSRIASIIDSVPPEYKEWLQNRLKFSNEVNLRTRLKEILQIYEEIIKEFLPANGDRMSFIGKVTDYRNALTHYSAETKQPTVQDLIEVYPNVKKIVELCLLSELGFSTKDISYLFNKENE